MQRSTEAGLLPFPFSFYKHFVWTQRKRNHVQKDHDCYDFLKLLLSRVQVQLLSIDSVRVTVESWSTSVLWCLSEDPLKANPWTCWPTEGKPTAWIVLLHSLSLGFPFFCAKPSAQKFCAGQRRCHARISKPRPTSPYSLHGGDG